MLLLSYHLLDLIIEAVSGESYEDFLQRTILQPLGMDDTGGEQHRKVVLRLAKGYAAIGETPLAAGNINMDIPNATIEFAMEGGEKAAALILHQGGQQRGERVE